MEDDYIWRTYEPGHLPPYKRVRHISVRGPWTPDIGPLASLLSKGRKKTYDKRGVYVCRVFLAMCAVKIDGFSVLPSAKPPSVRFEVSAQLFGKLGRFFH